jgi:hypothetical protein
MFLPHLDVAKFQRIIRQERPQNRRTEAEIQPRADLAVPLVRSVASQEKTPRIRRGVSGGAQSGGEGEGSGVLTVKAPPQFPQKRTRRRGVSVGSNWNGLASIRVSK